MGLLTLDGVNGFGYTKEAWLALSKKDRNKLVWKNLKGNLLPALLGGSVGASLLSKDKEFKTLGTIVTGIALTGGFIGADPATMSGTQLFSLLKSKGLNLLNLGSKSKLTTDQKAGFGLLSVQEIPSSLSFLGSNQAQITLDGKDENYLVNYDSFENLTSSILDAKGIKDAITPQIVQAIGKQKNAGVVKGFLTKLWKGVWNSAPEILQYMKSEGLQVEENTDGWDGTSGQIDDPTDPTDPKDPVKKEDPTADKGLIFGVKQEYVLGGAGALLLTYIIAKS